MTHVTAIHPATFHTRLDRNAPDLDGHRACALLDHVRDSAEARTSPERRLLRAVLVDALEIIVRYKLVPTRRRSRLVIDTFSWMLSDDHDWPFSFSHVCDVLDLDPQCVRRAVLA